MGAVTWMSASGLLSTGSPGGSVSSSNSLVGSTAGDKVGTIGNTSGLTLLNNDNLVIASTSWNNGGAAAGAGAVTWMNGTTGLLSNGLAGGEISDGSLLPANSLVGLSAGDQVGYGGIIQASGNFVVRSTLWGSAGVAANALGAVTWMSGTTGLLAGGVSTGGVVSASNSLVGFTAGDRVGNSIIALGNNVVVASPYWNNGVTAANAGAVTWMNGATGELSNSTTGTPVYGGTISAANSLVGSLAGDKIGTNTFSWWPYDSSGLTVLGNGNLVIASNNWNGTRGAVTWMSGSNGLLSNGQAGGEVSDGSLLPANSLVGSTAGDRVGSDRALLALNNNVVISSSQWHNGGAADAGAMTWMSGTNGRLSDGSTGGAITITNSLVGSTAGDKVGVSTYSWGADYNGWSASVLGNGNLVIASNNWNNGGVAAGAGAVTWMDGSTGLLSDGVSTGGAVSASNSLVGSAVGDKVGSNIVHLANDNVMVVSDQWHSAGAAVGAVTWMNGLTGELSNSTVSVPIYGGLISSANSVVGSTGGDMTGGYIIQLSNGNLLVRNPNWDNGANADVGALTWMNGLTGELSNSAVGARVYGGTIGTANSLVGAYGGVGTVVTYYPYYVYIGREQVGDAGVTELASGNVLVRTYTWHNPTTVADYAGAVTWMNGATGMLVDGNTGGTISETNSLVGDVANSQVGNYNLDFLGNGNVVIRSPQWNGSAGAVTWMDGAGALSDGSSRGVVSAANSLIGGTANDSVGSDGVIEVTDNSSFWNYVVLSSNWSNGAATSAGAITWVDGATGLTSDGLGTISTANSLVGTTAYDYVGNDFPLVLSNGNVVFRNLNWTNPNVAGATYAGAVTWMDGATGQLKDATWGGAISITNSLIGNAGSESVGSGGLYEISDHSTFWNYAVVSPYWNSSAGAVTLGNGATGTAGVVSASNSLVGGAANDAVGWDGIVLVSNGNSFVNYVVKSPRWGIAGSINYNDGLGAVTWVNGQTGQLTTGTVGGVVSSSNSLVGSTVGDQVGVAPANYNGLSGVNVLGNGNLLIRSQHWNGGVSALSWMDGSTGALAGGATGGVVSATNSLLGGPARLDINLNPLYDDLGSGMVGLITLPVYGNWVITSPDWGGFGAVTWMNSTTGQLADGTFGGEVSALNSQVGSAAMPRYLDSFCDCSAPGGVLALSDGNYVAYWQDNYPADISMLVWGNGASGSVGTVASNNSLSTSSLGVTEMTTQPGKVLVGNGAANGGEGGVYLLGGTAPVVGGYLFTDTPAVDAQIGAATIASMLNTANVVLQANNDITQSVGAAINATGTGNLTLQAGRSVILKDNVSIGGALDITANDAGITTAEKAAIAANRSPGPAIIETNGLRATSIKLTNTGGDIILGGNISKAGIAAGILDVQAANNILLQGTASGFAANITSPTGPLNVSLISDADGAGGGGIYLDTGSSINSNGGKIWLGGLPSTGYAIGNNSVTGGITFDSGIYVSGNITAGAGNVDMRGQGSATSGDGITFAGGTLSGSGTVNINGLASAGDGLYIGAGSTIGGTSSGNITVVTSSINNVSGGNPFTAASRWLIYSADPTLNTLGGIAANFKRYNCTFAGGCLTLGSSIPATGNGLLYSIAPTLTVNANAASKVYGSADPAYTHVVAAGLIDGDLPNTPDVLAGALGRTIATGESVAGGPYAIDQGTLTSPMGYGITYTPANLTITPAGLTVTANAASNTYGATAVFSGTEFTPTGLQFGDTIGSVTLNSTGAVATADVAGNPYAITASAATGGTFNAGNYIISYVDGALTVTPAALTITANSAAKTYGTALVFTGNEFTSAGLQNSESIGSVTLNSTGAAATAGVAGNPYAITANAAAGGTFNSGNYSISYVDGALSITPLNVTIAANNVTKVYGDADALTFTVSGLMSWDTNATAFTGAPGRVAGENVGTYAVNSTGTLTSTNYSFTGITPGSIVITQAPLTVTANAASKILNTTDPVLTYTVSGLKFTDTAAATLNGGSLSRVPGETVGAYQINQGSLGLVSTNYSMSYVPANLTILVPTVINEIVNTTLMFGPDTGSARSTSSSERDKAIEEILAFADIKPVDGTAGQPLPVCN